MLPWITMGLIEGHREPTTHVDKVGVRTRVPDRSGSNAGRRSEIGLCHKRCS